MNYEVGILESEYTSSFADGLQTMMRLAQIPRISRELSKASYAQIWILV